MALVAIADPLSVLLVGEHCTPFTPPSAAFCHTVDSRRRARSKLAPRPCECRPHAPPLTVPSVRTHLCRCRRSPRTEDMRLALDFEGEVDEHIVCRAWLSSCARDLYGVRQRHRVLRRRSVGRPFILDSARCKHPSRGFPQLDGPPAAVRSEPRIAPAFPHARPGGRTPFLPCRGESAHHALPGPTGCPSRWDRPYVPW